MLSMQMSYMLPHEGMRYEFWVVSPHVVMLRADTNCTSSNLQFFEKVDVVNNNKTYEEERILPPNMSTKIMRKFNQKHKQPTRKDFDQAIAEVFNKAEHFVLNLGLSGKYPSDGSDFWHVPKIGTFLETISDQSTSHFLAKILEGRKKHLDLGIQRPGGGLYDCETAKAIDRFNEAMHITSVVGSGVDALMKDAYPESANFSMASLMIEGFDSDDDTDTEDSIDNDADPGDDEAPAAKRVKLEMSSTADDQTNAYSALAVGTAPLAFRVREPDVSDGANKNDVGGSNDYGPFLEQMAKEDEAKLDEEDSMELEGN